jgi:Kef-type K+ transport system membrane component KefB
MGALLAGISLASTEYRDAIVGRLKAIRDFPLLFFFVALAARIEWAGDFSLLAQDPICENWASP